VFLTCSWVTANLAAGIFHIYTGNRLRADDGSAFVGFKQTKSPFFNYQGLIVCEVLLLVFGFCFICSAFVVDVQAIIYHFCSLQMVLVHMVKNIRWFMGKFPQRRPFCSPKERLPYFQGQGVVPHFTMCHYFVFCILMVVGAFSPWAWAAVHLPVGRVYVVSLLAFVISFVWCFVFCYPGLLRGVQVVSPRNMGVSCKHS